MQGIKVFNAFPLSEPETLVVMLLDGERVIANVREVMCLTWHLESVSGPKVYMF